MENMGLPGYMCSSNIKPRKTTSLIRIIQIKEVAQEFNIEARTSHWIHLDMEHAGIISLNVLESITKIIFQPINSHSSDGVVFKFIKQNVMIDRSNAWKGHEKYQL